MEMPVVERNFAPYIDYEDDKIKRFSYYSNFGFDKIIPLSSLFMRKSILPFDIATTTMDRLIHQVFPSKSSYNQMMNNPLFAITEELDCCSKYCLG